MKLKKVQKQLIEKNPKQGIPEEMAYQIATMRIRAGYTQEQLAKKLGTKQESISRLESGRQEPSLTTLFKIAKITGFEMKLPEFYRSN